MTSDKIVKKNEKGEYEIETKNFIITETGKLDLERLVRILLKHKYITG